MRTLPYTRSQIIYAIAKYLVLELHHSAKQVDIETCFYSPILIEMSNHFGANCRCYVSEYSLEKAIRRDILQIQVDSLPQSVSVQLLFYIQKIKIIFGAYKYYTMNDKCHKIKLIDLTFIIPIRIDSFDRYQNLLLVLKFLETHCDAPVIVLEADEFQHIEQNSLPENVAYYFVADEHEKFHRTHYINQLIGLSSTSYVAIWDTDVIVGVSQIAESMSWLRTNLCSAVLPYDGRCKDLAPQLKWNLGQTLKLDTESGTLYAEHACGGALIVNKQHFTEAGLCNEYLTS